MATAAAAAADAAPVAKKDSGMVGKYKLEKFLGQGNFATVYQAIDTEGGMRYAIKKIARGNRFLLHFIYLVYFSSYPTIHFIKSVYRSLGCQVTRGP